MFKVVESSEPSEFKAKQAYDVLAVNTTPRQPGTAEQRLQQDDRAIDNDDPE
jgi:hypothetical protein